MQFWLSAILIGTAVLLGGGTRAGFIGDVVVQFLAIPLLMATAWLWLGSDPRLTSPSQPGLDLPHADQSGTESRADQDGSDQSSVPAKARRISPLVISVVAAVAALLALQLTPLPAGLWAKLTATASALPQVRVAVPEAGTADQHDGWRTLSLTPHATWAAALSLLAPLAVFWAVAGLDLRSRLRLAWLVLALGGTSLALGFLQIAQGPESPLRFFDFTNATEAVGFFANRNHFAALLYVTLVLAAVWFAATARVALRPGALKTHAVVWFAAAVALVVALMAGLALARSRAGMLLALAAIAGIAAMVLVGRRGGRDGNVMGPMSVGRISVAVVGFATLFALQFGLHRILTRFDVDPLEDLRVPLTLTTLEAARHSLPFGTGLGSFVPVYATVEKATDIFGGYANRAHNDLAELLLETGLFGALLLLVFLAWFLRRAAAIWLSAPAELDPAHATLQRAATLVILLLLAHSLVDYPLRTTALAVVFAFACAILIAAPPSPVSDNADLPPGPDWAQRANAERVAPPLVVRERWGATVQWPQSWQQPDTTSRPRKDDR